MDNFDYAIPAELFDYSTDAELFSAKRGNSRRPPLDTRDLRVLQMLSVMQSRSFHRSSWLART
jgi:hypothetical protein